MNEKHVAKTSIADTIQRLKTDSRFKAIEEKVFKNTKKLKATEAQKFLLLFHLGLLNLITGLPLAEKDKALLVSVLLDINSDNARKYISETGKKIKPLLHTASNYNFLTEFFDKIHLESQRKEVDKIRLNILSKKK